MQLGFVLPRWFLPLWDGHPPFVGSNRVVFWIGSIYIYIYIMGDPGVKTPFIFDRKSPAISTDGGSTINVLCASHCGTRSWWCGVGWLTRVSHLHQVQLGPPAGSRGTGAGCDAAGDFRPGSAAGLHGNMAGFCPTNATNMIRLGMGVGTPGRTPPMGA